MTVSVYTMLEALSPAALNTLVAAAILAGQQPYGAPFSRVTPHGETSVCQAMITGSQVLVGASGAAGADATLDTDATMAANSDVVTASQKAIKTALALKAPLAAPTFTGGAVLATGASHTVDDVIAALQVRGIVKQS
jgi:hypothetical protein